MPLDTETPGSPGWWMLRLSRKLEGRRKRLDLLAQYLDGEPPLPENLRNLARVWQQQMETSRTNLALLISEAPRERMQIVGVRTAADADEVGDEQAWALWRRCGLPVASADVHRMMLGLGDAYVIVGWDDDNGVPVVTAEDPRQVVTIHDPRDQRRILAALKMFRDDEAEADFAYLYLPGRVFVARRATRRSAKVVPKFDGRSWEWDEELSGPLPAGFENVLPVVRFRNLDGKSEFEPHKSVLDRINRATLRRDVVTSYQAYRQRGIKGNLPDKDEHGVEINYDEVLAADPGAFWLLPPDVEIWESGQVDLTPLLSLIKSDYLVAAAMSRTPLAMITPDAAAQSAEGASLQREGLVFKVEDRIARADHGWAVVQSLMARFAGDAQRADVESIQPIWAPIERYSLAEMGSAWAQFVGLPVETKLRLILRLNPTDIARVKSEMQADAFSAALAAVQATGATVQPTYQPPPTAAAA